MNKYEIFYKKIKQCLSELKCLESVYIFFRRVLKYNIIAFLQICDIKLDDKRMSFIANHWQENLEQFGIVCCPIRQ